MPGRTRAGPEPGAENSGGIWSDLTHQRGYGGLNLCISGTFGSSWYTIRPSASNVSLRATSRITVRYDFGRR